MGSSLFQRLISFFIIIYVTRYLGPEKYGQYTFILTFASTFAIIWNFGLNTLLTREVAGNHELTSQYSGNVLLLKTTLFCCILPIALIFLNTLGYEAILVPFLLYLFGLFLSSISGVFRSVFIAYRRMAYPALQDMLRSVVMLIGVMVAVSIQQTGSVFNIVLCSFIAFGVVFIFLLSIFLGKFDTPKLSVDVRFVVQMLKKAFPFVLTSFVNIVLFKVDHLMLSKMTGDRELGLYGSAYTIFEIILAFFPVIIMNAAFPVLSMQFKNDINELKSLCNLLMKYFLLLGLPVSVGTFLLGDAIILGVYGPEYGQAGTLMTVLGASIWICFITSLTSWIITAIEKQHLVLISAAAAMVLNVVLNIILIPSYGAKGAAMTTLFCELVQMLFMYVMFRISLDIELDVKGLRIIFTTLIMGCFVLIAKYLMDQLHVVLLLTISISGGALIYFGIAYLLGIFSTKEVRFLLKY